MLEKSKVMIQILNEQKIEYESWKIRKFKIVPPVDLNLSTMYIGIDPGTVNLGVAVSYPFSNPTVEVFEVKIERDDNPINRIVSAGHILSDCINIFGARTIAVIEGSAFSQNYRQTELAEARASYVLWCINKGIMPYIVNPMTIRKKVFGKAKTKAEDVWKELPPNSASALACMYYAIQV